MAPPSSRKRRLPEGELDEYKQFIFHHFIELDRTDQQVCELLQKEYNFSISRAQLELRLRTWGFRKRITGPEWNFIHAQIDQLGGLSDNIRVCHWDKPVEGKQLYRTRRLHYSQETAEAATCPKHITIETRTSDGTWSVRVKSGERGIGVSSPSASLGNTSSRRIAGHLGPGAAQSFSRYTPGAQSSNPAVYQELGPLAKSMSPVINLSHTELIIDVRALLATTGQGMIDSISAPPGPRPSPDAQVTLEGYRDLLRHTPTEVFFRAFQAFQQEGRNLIIRPARGSATRVKTLSSFLEQVAQLGSNGPDHGPSTPGLAMITNTSSSDVNSAEDVFESASPYSGNFGAVFRSSVTFTERFPALLAYTLANNFAGVTLEVANNISMALQDFPGLGVAMARLFKAQGNNYSRAMAEALLSLAVEGSDGETIRVLLENDLVNINQRCCKGLAPIDRAAQLQDTETMCSLLALGANPNDRKSSKTEYYHERSTYGTLHHLVHAWSEQGAFFVDERRAGAVKSLLDGGAEILPHTVHHLFLLGTDDAIELASDLLRFLSPIGLGYLIEHGFLEHIATQIEDQPGLKLTQEILTGISWTQELRYHCPCYFRSESRCIHKMVGKAGVAAVRHGKVELLRWLLPLLARDSSRILVVICNTAILYGNRNAVDLLLTLLPRTGGCSWDGEGITSALDIQDPDHTTPYASAVIKQDQKLLDYFEGNGVLDEENVDAENSTIWCSALIAAAMVSDISRLERFSRHEGIRECLISNKYALRGNKRQFLIAALNFVLKNRDEKASILVLSICVRTGCSMDDLMFLGKIKRHPLAHALSWQHEQLVGALCNLGSALIPYAVNDDDYDDEDDEKDDGTRNPCIKFLAAQWGHPLIMECIHVSRPREKMRGWEQVILLDKGGMKLLDDLHSMGYIQAINFEAILRHAILHRDEELVTEVLSRITTPSDNILTIAINHDRQDILNDLLSNISRPPHISARKDFGCRCIQATMRKRPMNLNTLKALLTSPHINAFTACFQTSLRCAIDEICAGNLQDLRVVQLILASAPNPARLICQFIPISEAQEVIWLSTPFLEAIKFGRTDLVQLLIKHGADVNQRACLGITRTPLQNAVEINNLAMVDLLLQHEADPNLPAADLDGATALQLAAETGNCEIAARLLERGADLHAPPGLVKGFRPLEGAAREGRFDMIQYLWQVASLEQRLFPYSQCEEAIHAACGMQHNACAQQIEELMANHPEYSLAVNEPQIVETRESPEPSSRESPSRICMDIDISTVSSEQTPDTNGGELHIYEGALEPQIHSLVEGDRPVFTQAEGMYEDASHPTTNFYNLFDEQGPAGSITGLTPSFE